METKDSRLPKVLLDADDMAALLQCTRQTILKMARVGAFPFPVIRMSRRTVRFPIDAVSQFVDFPLDPEFLRLGTPFAFGQVATLLGVTKMTISQWVAGGKIQTIRAGDMIRVPLREVARMLHSDLDKLAAFLTSILDKPVVPDESPEPPPADSSVSQK